MTGFVAKSTLKTASGQITEPLRAIKETTLAASIIITRRSLTLPDQANLKESTLAASITITSKTAT